MRSKSSVRFIVVIGALALLALMPVGHATVNSAQAPSAKRRVWQAPVLVSDNQAHRETSLALDPTNPDNLFICDPSGVPNLPNNQSYFHQSKDGGKTWKFLRVETDQTDMRNYAYEGGDCDVAYDAAGTMYTADTWLGDLSVGHSTDGGKTWSGTALAGTSPIIDRPWLVGGDEGTVYLTYQDLQCCSPSAIWFAKSTDSGNTFSPAVPVTTFAGHGTPPDPNEGPDGGFTWEGNFVVDNGGQDLYLVYTRRVGPGVNLNNNPIPAAESVRVAASHDGGLTWNSHLVSKTQGSASYLYPSIGLDKAGGLHVAYSSAGKGDHPIWYSYSKDEAEQWTKPKALLTGVAGYSPWVAGGSKAGEAAIAWYGSSNPKADGSVEAPWYFYTARVADGGKSITDAGATTTKPIFEGKQTIPEFEMVRLDSKGNIHIGMSAFRVNPTTKQVAWAIYYQRQELR
jgi:hypothetical protein